MSPAHVSEAAAAALRLLVSFAIVWGVDSAAGVPVESASPGFKIGAYTGGYGYAIRGGRLARYEAWFGRPMDVVIDTTPQEAAWKHIKTDTYGLDWWVQFAKQHGKPLGVPEWALWDRYKDKHSGLDNPSFIRNMFEWAQANGIRYLVYFDRPHSANRMYHNLFSDETERTTFPLGAVEFKRLFH